VRRAATPADTIVRRASQPPGATESSRRQLSTRR
jgi:hypothetical protein